jgi:hypothetical protein
MTAEQQGVYRNLLDELWLRDGCIPNDERILAKIGGDPEAWPRVREVVLARFQKTQDGLRHETHDEVSKWPTSQAEKGRKRAEHATRAGGRFTSPAPAEAPAIPPAGDQPEPPAQHQPPSPSPSPYSVTVSVQRTTDSDGDFAKRFLAITGAAFGRKYRVVDPEVTKKLKARLKDWQPWQILAAPILVAAQVPAKLENLSPEILLRDGSNPRTRDGQTYGGYYWLAKTYERVDGTKLDARLRAIAEQAGVLDALLSCGVVVDADA